MLLYCLKCRKNTQSKNPVVVKTKNRRIMLSPKLAVSDSKNIDLSKSKRLVHCYVA